MKIYYNATGYPLKRMIISKTSYEYEKISKAYDAKLLFLYLFSKVFPQIKKDNIFNRIEFIYKPIINLDGIFHGFNTIYIGKARWVSTMEYMFPAGYYNMTEESYLKYAGKLVKYLAQDNCIKLLPMSEFSKNRIVKDIEFLSSPNETEKILKKIYVIHPPQAELITEKEIKAKYNSNTKINICFVGRDFWRKGGYISLKALKRLRKKYNNFNFILVSSLLDDGGWYVSEKDNIKQEILDCDFIEWYEELENNKVIELLKKSHLGLLPTYGDTYGFSVLEMQACGCPCVTTDGFALPEINNDECGWLMNQANITADSSHEERLQEQEKIIENITNILEKEIFGNENYLSIIEKKAMNSLIRIRTEHNPERYKDKLEEIYKCVSNDI
jgi:glycosyltransferase involved in cell wall biosynthesis